MKSTPASHVSGRRRPVWLRLCIAAAAMITAWHLLASFLWIAPAGPARDITPGDSLRSYMIPMFGQSWSVFAPEPINGEHRLDVRAVVQDGDAEVITEWVSATDVELSLSRHNLFPPRAAGLAVGVAADYKNSFDKLTDDHKVIVGLNYFEAEWDTRLEDKLRSYEDTATVTRYLDEEATATAYATQVALAVWGEDVVRVQFQASRQNVVPFADRNDPDAERPAVQVVQTGWRGLTVREGQSTEQFAQYFCSAPEKVCQ